MRVLIDATPVPADRGGVGRYVDELVPALVRIGVDVAAAVQSRDAAALRTAWDGADVVAAPRETRSRQARFAWEQVGLPGLARRMGADVLHSVHYTSPVRPSTASVITVHDATFFSHPELHGGVKGRFFRAAVRRAVRAADEIVVPSAATRDEVLRFAGGDPVRFTIAPHGVDVARFHPADEADIARVRSTLGLADLPYVAFLGTLEPRKNVPALIRAWIRASAGRAVPPALVLAGGPGWDDQVAPAIAAVPAGLTLVRPGYLPLGDLAAFFSGAEVVAYPSLGEGFGLPVLEAMACGAPVLTTPLLSIPEVGGDAVAYTAPDDTAIADSLTGLLNDPRRRAALRGAAIARARTFTWEASARAHLVAYHRATERRRSTAG
ncbi:MAG TPA: glycosyltransferase family 1 protein [Cellulomonas sp.]